ncbi:class I SAM-dependent methyltransferase [Acidimangrovimonas sediminis]|uniref:class I SAM-dependent methyltransferase n=1 Tax=Acidimangrovimonas sediminis TaxID=2056283 RepID=UPI001304ED81|nr:class I SAM-dependent methyltransferase [Acidimangrovimonas sediminis]
MPDLDVVPLDIAAEAQDPAIRALDVSMFDRQDLLNMLLQRSEVLYDVPRYGQVIKAWGQGDPAPIEAEIDRLGEEIARRVAGVIHAEYRAMAVALKDLEPRRVADIGCGYAIWDLFAHRDLACDIVLIDIESNEHRHFGYAEEGAAYTSLGKARAFLEANGVPEGSIVTVNPTSEELKKAGVVDLAASFVSCGFHYPAATYLEFFRGQVSTNGAVLLDLRMKRADDQVWDLATMGPITLLPGHPKARRMLLRKVA